MLSEEEKKELEMLKSDPAVKLATKSYYDKDKQRLYRLRWLKKKGEKLKKKN